MNKRKRIKLLERELSLTDHALEQAEDDYQHTHDTLWQILQLLCNEFNMSLQAVPKDEFTDRLVEALERADQLVPHSQRQDDVMDDVFDLVNEYRNPKPPCTDNQCTRTNGIGCVNVPVEEW